MSALPNTMPTSSEDKEKLLALLRESRERFLGSFADVSDEQSRCRLAEGCWSVLDTVEHVTMAETLMLRLVSGPRRPRPAGAPNREEIFIERVGNRNRKVEAPERGRPSGRFAGLDEARRQFETARAGAIRFVEETKDDLRATELTHPHPMFGDVSACEMLIIMAKHAERHALQIEEIKNSLAFRGGQG
ncbi:MAG TPA: DinB family protein [Candidatus Angelobacter sp.]